MVKQFVKYINDKILLSDRQSAARSNYSTETVLADILMALPSSDLAMLTFLDLSPAFDGVDHDTLPQLLQI